MLTALPFEWFILLLRIIFIFLVYFFIFQVVRVAIREMTVVASRRSDSAAEEIGGHLVVREAGGSGYAKGSMIGLEPVTVIGRHPRATIRVDDTFVSSEHAQVSWHDGRWWITDLQSTNGTLLNGQPLTAPTGLRYGDVIGIGEVQLQFAP